MSLNELAEAAHKNSVEKGFYGEGQSLNVAEKLMLVVSEISEALEAHRNNKRATDPQMPPSGDFVIEFKARIKDTFEDEIADAIIRLLDLSAWMGINIEYHVKAKMKYNKTRPHLHGKLY